MRLRLSLALLCGALMLSVAAFAYVGGKVDEGGSITGTIRYGGTPPKPIRLDVAKDMDVCGKRPIYDQSLVVGPQGGIANAVVTLPDLDHGKPAPPAGPVQFDQKGCEYTPHVAVFSAGSTVEVINSDGILHNIHTESVANPPQDMAQPGFKKMIRITIAKPEAIKVTCDAHNWMEGWWYAAGNPYHALTGPDGHYELKDVPPGTYTIEVWQEKLGVQTRQVTVKPGASMIADFTLGPKHN